MPRAPLDTDLSELPEAEVAAERGWSLSIVWLIPLLALMVGGWLAGKAILERGPTISISFKNAEGLEAGKTKIKYKNVDVGVVKHIKLSDDHQQIVAIAEFAKGSDSYLVDDTRFWVVRPRIAGGHISGLGTLFSGSYIGLDIGKSTTSRDEFVGLDRPPIVESDVPGRHFILQSEDLGFLDVGSPLYHRQVSVGSVVAYDLNQDGKAVALKVFINAPYDRYVTTNTRFWNASGIDVAIDATGIKVNAESVTSIFIGGIAFETPSDATSASIAEENRTFLLAKNRTQAMKLADAIAVPAMLYFTDSIRGLSIGSPVEFRGVTVGEVTSMNVVYDEAENDFRFPIGVTLYPGRLATMATEGSAATTDPAVRRTRWNALNDRGLRYQLRTANLLTGQLYVALDFFPDAPKAHIDWAKTPPVLPTVQGSMTEVQETFSRFARKLEKIPLDQIGGDLRQSLRALSRTLESADLFLKRLDKDVAPAARVALEEAGRTFSTAERTFKSDAPLQQDLRDTLRDVSRAAQAMRVLADYLERHPEALLRGKKEHKP